MMKVTIECSVAELKKEFQDVVKCTPNIRLVSNIWDAFHLILLFSRQKNVKNKVENCIIL